MLISPAEVCTVIAIAGEHSDTKRGLLADGNRSEGNNDTAVRGPPAEARVRM